MVKKYSNQRITKIKKDPIEALLRAAENTPVEQGTSMQPAGSDLTPYPDMSKLRSWIRDYLLKGVTKVYRTNINENGTIDYRVILDGLILNTKNTKTLKINDETKVETSKPGLWLSNLSHVYSESLSGGYIRQNLIHSGDSINNINSDTIGNLSFSFLQRGVFHRDAGSSHSNNDSYAQHWSPSALSCISHDSIIIPGNELQNTYTLYQSLVFPKDVNMQNYGELDSKDINYVFADNKDTLSNTNFNGRVVGGNWTYEYDITVKRDSDNNVRVSGEVTRHDGCTTIIDETLNPEDLFNSKNYQVCKSSFTVSNNYVYTTQNVAAPFTVSKAIIELTGSICWDWSIYRYNSLYLAHGNTQYIDKCTSQISNKRNEGAQYKTLYSAVVYNSVCREFNDKFTLDTFYNPTEIVFERYSDIYSGSLNVHTSLYPAEQTEKDVQLYICLSDIVPPGAYSCEDLPAQTQIEITDSRESCVDGLVIPLGIAHINTDGTVTGLTNINVNGRI